MTESAQTQCTLGDLRMIREAGRGQMAIVYEAEQISMKRRVAVKVLPLALQLRPDFVQAFMNESRIMARLNHSNIVPVFMLGCERGVHHIAMEFIEGRSINKFVEERPKDDKAFELLIRLFVQAALALDHAHQLAVIHRDIEPDNLLIDNDGKLWLVDWGLAQFHDSGALSMAGGAWGKLPYTSPELALRQGPVDQRADVYSLGAVLYELVTQKPSLEDRDREEMFLPACNRAMKLRRIGVAQVRNKLTSSRYSK